MIPEDLNRHNCLYASTLVGGNKWVFERDGEMTAVDIAQTVEVEDSQFIKTVAINGGGIGYLPLSLIEEELEQGVLVPILKEYTNSDFEFSLYYRPRRQMPVRCVNFKEYLIRRVRELADQS